MTAETGIKKGELLTIAMGEYSDFTVSGVFRVLENFEPQEVIDAYLEAHPDERGSYSANFSEFIGWLATSKRIEGLDSREWHIGSYGTFDTSIR